MVLCLSPCTSRNRGEDHGRPDRAGVELSWAAPTSVRERNTGWCARLAETAEGRLDACCAAQARRACARGCVKLDIETGLIAGRQSPMDKRGEARAAGRLVRGECYGDLLCPERALEIHA